MNIPRPCPACDCPRVTRIVYPSPIDKTQHTPIVYICRCQACDRQWFEGNPGDQSANPWTFTTTGMLAMVAAVSILFALQRAFGRDGILLGIFVVVMSVGFAFKLPRLIFGGAIASTIFFGVYSSVWFCYGNLNTMDWRYCMHVIVAFEELEQEIKKHENQNGMPPDKLSDLAITRQPGVNWAGNSEDWTAKWHYIRCGNQYELFFLGRDHQVGGVGVNADIQQAEMSRVFQARLPLRQFLNGTPGSGGPFGAVLLINLCLLYLSWKTSSDEICVEQLWGRALAFALVAACAVVVGVLIATFLITGGQSSH